MPADNISEIEQQLELARRDLFQTFEQVNRKVEAQLHLRSRIRKQPLVALAAVAGLGFLLGRTRSRAASTTVAILAIAAAATFTVRVAMAGPRRTR